MEPEPEFEPESESADIPPWPLWTVPAALVLGLSFTLVAVSIISSLGGASLSRTPPGVSLAESFAQDASFLAGVLGFATVMVRGRPANFGFRRVPIGLAVGYFLIAGVGYYAFSFLYAAALNIHSKDSLPKEWDVQHSTVRLIVAIVFVCLVAPIVEEVIFRGFIFGALRRMQLVVRGRQLGTWVAAAITGVLFGAVHAGSAPAGALVLLGVLGFVLCLVRWRTGSLYPCIALHSLNNALAIGLLEHWNPGEVIGLVLAAVAVVGAITAPLAAPALPGVTRPT